MDNVGIGRLLSYLGVKDRVKSIDVHFFTNKLWEEKDEQRVGLQRWREKVR